VERVAKVVEVNHRLRPFKKETLKTAGRGAEGAVLYRALRVLRCLVKMPCTCLKVGGTRCVGCEPVVSSAQSTVSWITFGRAGVEMVHCPVFRFLSKVVTGLKSADITESQLFDHLAKTVLVTEDMVSAKRNLLDKRKKVHYWYDPTERGVEGQKYTIYSEFDGLKSGGKLVSVQSKRLAGPAFLEPSVSSFDRELGRAMLQAVMDDQDLQTESGRGPLLMGVDKVLDGLDELTRVWRPCAQSGPPHEMGGGGAATTAGQCTRDADCGDSPQKKQRRTPRSRLTGVGLAPAAGVARAAQAARAASVGAGPGAARPRVVPPPLPTGATTAGAVTTGASEQHGRSRPRAHPPPRPNTATRPNTAATATTATHTPVSGDTSLRDAVAKLPAPIASAWQLLGMPKIVAAVRQDAAKRVLFTQLAKNSSTANCNVAAALVMLCVDAIDENMGDESRCCGGGLGRSGG
jgi:hypothetical protein